MLGNLLELSFQHKSFWIPRDAGCLTDGEVNYDSSSRIENKRGHQWFMDGSAPELFSSKKQAIETVNTRTVPGVPHMNVSPWENTSSFQSVPGPFTDRLFGSEPIRTVNLVDRSITVGNANMDMGRKEFENHFANNPSVGLSMSQSIEDPSSCLNFGGIRKVKVNQVRDADIGMSASLGHAYSSRGDGTVSMGTAFKKIHENAISLGQSYNSRDENSISVGPAYHKTDDSFISMGHAFSKGDGNFITNGHNYSKGDNSILSMSQPFDKGDYSFISMGQSYEKAEGNIISFGASYNKGHENFISMGPAYSKAGDTFISMASPYNKGNDDISMGPTYDKVNSDIVHVGPKYDKADSGAVSMAHNYHKGESNTISFGGFDDENAADNPSGGIISSYDLLMANQASAQASEVSNLRDSVDPHAEVNFNNATKVDVKIDTSSKNKEPRTTKKVPPNSFPSNVKSLLSTGMLDGVPVKYVSWSREKNLKGIIKGTGYLCSCDNCNHSKALNAYEFERHAGCKTKHPNNHIYFENGKTIYAVVQELKNTPQELLFDAIQNVTGSPINQKNFRIWKASYQAATLELQRIYGKDEVTIPS
ncbi:uncharacterized protein LOC111472013 isoform X1 [Cucurbita maxima]|uniref:Uncharacterized protein LOC111472013 isoform X1 n=1 Tax=Cucurbita maxima TaxID=3661 RepID=A0A6J1IBR0_CUCMA|nr:uncharacterized protein LOC111472013 isoform X1 [Cucurbita maxima]XP_022973562.1 uncharacterized protein LOC111472013 isoform X1 [Cucurbita maxima]XP_022973585.1 uncharacterized protein LOC111472013 isoform X1 [Cucurbita maxima]XP_022973626.1 uncharacterized protein LOC111472013 isoform X1 [Cucurbita maxima]